jgi:predicted DNA-binding transcriptional regulator AlpA
MKFFGKKEVCAILGVSPATLERMIDRRHFPQGDKLGPYRNSPRRWLDTKLYDWMQNVPVYETPDETSS